MKFIKKSVMLDSLFLRQKLDFENKVNICLHEISNAYKSLYLNN